MRHKASADSGKAIFDSGRMGPWSMGPRVQEPNLLLPVRLRTQNAIQLASKGVQRAMILVIPVGNPINDQ